MNPEARTTIEDEHLSLLLNMNEIERQNIVQALEKSQRAQRRRDKFFKDDGSYEKRCDYEFGFKPKWEKQLVPFCSCCKHPVNECACEDYDYEDYDYED